MKEEFLQTLDFDHFTSKELASDVRKSGLFAADKIIEGMEYLSEMKNRELETLRKDINTVKSNLNRRIYLSGAYYNLWSYVDADVRSRNSN